MTLEPALVGPIVAWRPATHADAPALLELWNAGFHARGEADESRSLDEVHHELDDPSVSLVHDSRVGLDAAGRILAWGAVWSRLRPVTTARAVLFGEIHPEVQRQGIGGALLAWQLARAEERFATEVDPTLPRRVDLYASAGDVGREALATAAGMTPVRWFSKMTRSLREPVAHAEVPAGLEMEAWTDARSGATKDALNDGWRDHWGYEPIPDEIWQYRFHDDTSFLPPASRLAIADGTVVGLVLCTEQTTDDAGEGRTAWLDLIAVRRAWRRRGIASALISASLVALAEEGFRMAALQVDTANPTDALGLYERHGFAVRRTETVFAIETPSAG